MPILFYVYSLWIKKLNDIENPEANREKIRLLYYACPLRERKDVETHFDHLQSQDAAELRKDSPRMLAIGLLEEIFNTVNDTIDRQLAYTLPGFAVLYVNNSITQGLTPKEIYQNIKTITLQDALSYIDKRYTTKPEPIQISKEPTPAPSFPDRL